MRPSLVSQIRNRASLTLEQLGALTGIPSATLSAYEQELASPNLETLELIAERCGLVLNVTLTARITHFDGLPRGEELEAVLRLAEHFPSNTSKTLGSEHFPREPFVKLP